MEVVRPIFGIGTLAALLGLFFEFVPGGRPLVDVAAAACALANWIVPLLLFALMRKPKTSLGSVGFFISIFVVAASLSLSGLSLAILTFIFARGGNWAWAAILAIAAFWPFAGVAIAIGGRGRPQPGERPKQAPP